MSETCFLPARLCRLIRVLLIPFVLITHPPAALSGGNIESVRELLEAGKADEALKRIEDMTSEDSQNDEVRYLKAVVYLLKMSEDQAETLLEQIRSAENQGISGDAYFRAGRILLNESEKAHAGLHYLNRAVSFSPDKRESAALLLKEHGIALAAVKPWLSHRMLDKAAQFSPTLKEDDLFYYTYMIQTVTAPRQQIEAADLFIGRYPGSQLLPEALYKKAEALYMLAEFSPSKSVFQEIAEKYPGTPGGKKAADRLTSWKEFRQKIITISPGTIAVNTGLTIEEGERLIISAQGFSKEGVLFQGPEGRKKRGDVTAGLPLPSASPMALIGRIGEEGPWFPIGKSFVGQTDRSGEIMLMMNRPQNEAKEIAYSGSYSVMVRVE